MLMLDGNSEPTKLYTHGASFRLPKWLLDLISAAGSPKVGLAGKGRVALTSWESALHAGIDAFF